MTLASALPILQETAQPALVGALPAERVAEIRSFVAREMAEVEELLRRRVAGGVSPGRESAQHLVESGGKRVRPLGLMLAAACFGTIDARARDLATAAEIVHMATLLHDDVIDDGDQRRGRPTSRRVWGNAVSVLAGDMLLVEALRLASLGAGASDTATWTELVATLGKLVDGEIVQLRGRTAVSLEEATYFEIVRGKTASLFEWSLRAGARSGGAPSEAIDALGRFGASLGVAFQLVDDLLDYDGDAAKTGKTLFADLAEGKVTLPLIRAAAMTGSDVASLVGRVRAGDADAARDLGVRVRESGACEKVRALARAETDRALSELAIVRRCAASEALADVARGLAARVS
ncbi:MAG: polyprenyl synthetase family protein [Labilithrix sp.]|nr:polyprenyl synthetase family protein [Labilithrix sp.]MCW5813905.1 polyprenyl synthetase family protein [Labilithrix sp.]